MQVVDRKIRMTVEFTELLSVMLEYILCAFAILEYILGTSFNACFQVVLFFVALESNPRRGNYRTRDPIPAAWIS
jgi:hypothetical protein